MRIRILGALILVVGFCMMIFAKTIENQLEIGRAQMETGEVHASINSEEVGLQPPAEPYGESNEEYDAHVRYLRIAGTVVCLIGLIIIVIF